MDRVATEASTTGGARIGARVTGRQSMKRPAYAILRIDDFPGERTPIENRVTVVQVRLEMEAAEKEVERLK